MSRALAVGVPDPLPTHETEVLVIGPGAIGSIVAARLSQAGLPVTVACRTAKTAQHVAKRGVVAVAEDGAKTVAKAHAVADPADLQVEPSIVFLATKCADAEDALRAWTGKVPRDTPIVALQNGLMGGTLAPLAAGRYVESVVHFPATLESTGHSVQTGPGGFDVGSWPTPSGPSCAPGQAHFAANVLKQAATTRVVDNIVGAKWTKLIINSCISTLGVATGRTLGDLLQDERARDVFLAIADEGYHVGRAAGVRFETIQRFHPARFASRGGGGVRRAYLHTVLRVVGRKYRRHRSSSLQSLERGTKTEVDHLNGVIVAKGAEHGVQTPVNAALVETVHAIEEGGATPGPGLLVGLPVRRRAKFQ